MLVFYADIQRVTQALTVRESDLHIVSFMMLYLQELQVAVSVEKTTANKNKCEQLPHSH